MNPVTESNMVNETLVDDRSRVFAGSTIDQHPQPIEHAGASKSLLGRLARTFLLVVALFGGVVFALYKTHVNIPALNTSKVYAYIDSTVMHAERTKGYVVGQYESHFGKHVEEAHHEQHKILATSPVAKDVTITQDYVCQIRSQRHIEIRALDDGYLEAISIKEGQAIKTDDLMFQIKPVIYKAELAAEVADRDLARLEFNNTRRLAERQGVSQNEVLLFEARLARAQAKMDLAQAKLNFTAVKAPFDGIVDRLKEQQGSLVKEGDILTTLSDNSVMWVYFNVTEKRYLEYMAETGQNKLDLDVVLMLANHDKFPHLGKIDLAHKVGAIAANFNNETGNIAFRADFSNPDGLLRHGQTGTVSISRALKGAIVIPQRATFENLAKRYVYVIDEDKKVHQREITVDQTMEDVYVVEKGILDVADKIILEGIRQVREGEEVEYEFRQPEDVIKNAKNRAE